jgi:hypothetical protein
MVSSGVVLGGAGQWRLSGCCWRQAFTAAHEHACSSWARQVGLAAAVLLGMLWRTGSELACQGRATSRPDLCKGCWCAHGFGCDTLCPVVWRVRDLSPAACSGADLWCTLAGCEGPCVSGWRETQMVLLHQLAFQRFCCCWWRWASSDAHITSLQQRFLAKYTALFTCVLHHCTVMCLHKQQHTRTRQYAWASLRCSCWCCCKVTLAVRHQ